jgi:hypothetical protein
MAATTCAYCSKNTHMTEFGNQVNVVWDPVYSPGGAEATAEAPFTCDHCHRLSIGIGRTQSDPNDYTDHDSRWGWSEYEPGVKWAPKVGVGREYPDVPEHIAAAASEAHECQSIGAHRAAVMLARAVMEATAKNKGITNGPLFTKIEKMYEQNFLREHIKEQAHEVRHLGNDMAHGDFVEPISTEEADEVLELMAEVLHEVFESQARLLRVRNARLARKNDEQA